jgi:hypothetical protein
MTDDKKGGMTVAEAGRKGGKTTKQRYGREYYVGIGKEGGRRVKEIMKAGKAAMGEKPTVGKALVKKYEDFNAASDAKSAEISKDGAAE